MRLRYPGTCRVCAAALPAKTEAIYERESKTIRCVTHGDLDLSTPVSNVTDQPPAPHAEAVDVGVPGASARREFERRRLRREDQIRTAHPKIGGLIHALTDDPQSTTAWDLGAVGEKQLGQHLNELANENLRVVQALWPKKLYPQLTSDGPIDVETIAAVHHTLATALPPASEAVAEGATRRSDGPNQHLDRGEGAFKPIGSGRSCHRMVATPGCSTAPDLSVVQSTVASEEQGRPARKRKGHHV